MPLIPEDRKDKKIELIHKHILKILENGEE